MFRTIETVGICGRWQDLIVDDNGEIYICMETLSKLSSVDISMVHTITYPITSKYVMVTTTNGVVRKMVFDQTYMVEFLKRFNHSVFTEYVEFLSLFCNYPITYL